MFFTKKATNDISAEDMRRVLLDLLSSDKIEDITDGNISLSISKITKKKPNEQMIQEIRKNIDLLIRDTQEQSKISSKLDLMKVEGCPILKEYADSVKTSLSMSWHEIPGYNTEEEFKSDLKQLEKEIDEIIKEKFDIKRRYMKGETVGNYLESNYKTFWKFTEAGW